MQPPRALRSTRKHNQRAWASECAQDRSSRTSSGCTAGLVGAAATGAADAEAAAAAEKVDCSRCCSESTEFDRRLRRLVLSRPAPAPSVLPEVDAVEVEVVPGHRRQLRASGARENDGGRGGDWRARVVVRGDVVVVAANATDTEEPVGAAPIPPPVPPPPALARIAAKRAPQLEGGRCFSPCHGGAKEENQLPLSLSTPAKARKSSRKNKQGKN